MPKRHDHLFERVANFQALHQAARRAVRGKRRKPGAAAFFANLEKELLRLERELLAQSYRPGRYITIEIHDPKCRLVSAAPFRDRVVHHALMAAVEPIFERGEDGRVQGTPTSAKSSAKLVDATKLFIYNQLFNFWDNRPNGRSRDPAAHRARPA
jgi:hypothetical protein